MLEDELRPPPSWFWPWCQNWASSTQSRSPASQASLPWPVSQNAGRERPSSKADAPPSCGLPLQSDLKAKYDQLVTAGKPTKLAITRIMRNHRP